MENEKKKDVCAACGKPLDSLEPFSEVYVVDAVSYCSQKCMLVGVSQDFGKDAN